MSTSIKLNVHFAPGSRNRRILRKGRQPRHSKSTRLPRITRLMALALRYEGLLEQGLVGSHSELARLAGTDRSHISTILRLRLLAPDIQEWLINLPETEKGSDPIGLMELREISSYPSWNRQRKQLRTRVPDLKLICAPEASAMPTAHKRKKQQGETDEK